jgi:hypothetical protein
MSSYFFPFICSKQIKKRTETKAIGFQGNSEEEGSEKIKNRKGEFYLYFFTKFNNFIAIAIKRIIFKRVFIFIYLLYNN